MRLFLNEYLMGSRLIIFGILSSVAVSANSTQVSQSDLSHDEAANANPEMITGLYGSTPRIEISDGSSVSWAWNTTIGVDNLSSTVRGCIQEGRSATEVKFASDGSRVVAIIGYSAIVITHSPVDDNDMTVEFGVCLNGPLGNAHTLELLPGGLLAIATTGQSASAGLWIYDTSDSSQDPQPLQKISGVRAIHGMLWDEQTQTLWVAGNTDAADGSGSTAYGIVQGYKYSSSSNPLSKSTGYTMPNASNLQTEWSGTSFATWWDGPHDTVPIPSTRKVLIPMDQDIHMLDLSTGKFDDRGQQLATTYLKGFTPVGKRTGSNGQSLPRSDIKSISLLPDGSALYTQAVWQAGSGIPSQVNLLDPSGSLTVLQSGYSVYRSRWFTSIPGWPTAQ